MKYVSWDSSVGIVTRLTVGQPRKCVQIFNRSKRFFACKQRPGPIQPPVRGRGGSTGDYFHGGHSPQSVSEVKSNGAHTSARR
jgi:hypothetical protein